MCGRFTQVVKAGVFVAMYGAAVPIPDVELPERWNGAPTQAFLVCRLDAAGRRVLSLQRWGLVPSWVRDRSIGSRLINARSETAAGKSAFRAAFRRRRCLVPANGWFEWRRTPAGKEPTWIRLAGGRPFSFAGLWEVWGEGESRRESFTILTCPAGEALEPVHARQPAIVVPEEYGGLAGRRNAGRAGAGAARGAVRAPAGEHADQQSAERRAGGHAAGGRVRCSLPAGGRDGCGCTWTSTFTRHPLRRQTTHSRARRAVATRPARRAERHGRAGWSRLSTCLSHQPPAADADPTVSTALNAATTCPRATRSGPGAGLASCLVGNAG